jgi:hypothetical protein
MSSGRPPLGQLALRSAVLSRLIARIACFDCRAQSRCAARLASRRCWPSLEWSRHSHRIEPTSHSAYGFCQGDRAEIGRSRMLGHERDGESWRTLDHQRMRSPQLFLCEFWACLSGPRAHGLSRRSIALRAMTRLKFPSAIRLRNFRDRILISGGHPNLISSGPRSQRQIDMAVTPHSFCTCGSGQTCQAGRVVGFNERGVHGHGAAPFLNEEPLLTPSKKLSAWDRVLFLRRFLANCLHTMILQIDVRVAEQSGRHQAELARPGGRGLHAKPFAQI